MVSSVLQPQPTLTTAETLLRLRHTCAHVLAMTVQSLFPETKIGSPRIPVVGTIASAMKENA
ncbi:MAG: hypothetical protein MUF49_11430 [Oculatellaceae cyanobacterium Prado106]|nr:hypothetical protein [Oculatellaceae cyanobacterium Prado106]